MSPCDAASSAFTRMLHALDLREWQAVRDAFADQVDIDYSSLFGVPAAHVNADDQIGGWRSFVGAFDATQHVTGPVIAVEGRDGELHASTHVRGYHRIGGAPGGDVWMVAGHYEVRLAHRRTKWRIVGLTLKVFYQEGNLDLPRLAQARAVAPQPVKGSPA